MIDKKPFTSYTLEEDRKDKNKPISVKLNEKDKEMIAIGGYCLNMHSTSGILKELAYLGVKVILDQFGMDRMHYLTRGNRTRLIIEKPKIYHFQKKVDEI